MNSYDKAEKGEKAFSSNKNSMDVLVHDLKNPLTTIMAAFDFLEAEYLNVLPEDHKNVLLAGAEASSRLNDMLKNILDVGKMEGGKLLPNKKKHDIVHTAKEAVEGVRRVAAYSEVKLEESYPNEELLLTFDNDIMRRVFSSLLSNSIKHVSAGGCIKVALERAGDFVSCSVMHNCAEISESYPCTVSDESFKAEGVPYLQRAAGLNLIFCRMAIELHGGTISATSKEGETVFNFKLPYDEKNRGICK